MSHQKCVRRECVRRKNVRRKNFDQTCKLYTIGPRRGDQIEWMGRKRCPRGAPRRGEQKIIKSFFYFISPSHIPLLLCNSPTPLIELWLSPQQWRCVLIHCWDFLLYCFCLPGRFKQSFNWHPPPIQQIGHGGIILFVMLINELLHYQKTTASIRSARPKFRAIALLRAILVALWTDFKKNLTSLWSYKCMDEWLVSTIISS